MSDGPASPPTAPIFVVEHISLAFGGLQVLDDVGFSVVAGQAMGIIGPNGAGKSSLLNCVNGLYRPQAGSVRLDGRELIGQPVAEVARRGIARTFQGVELFSRMTAFENVVLASEQAVHGEGGRGRARRRLAAERSAEALGLLGLAHLAGERVSHLSFGEQKAVALARALAMKPRVVLLDEPTSGMGGGDRRAIGELVIRLREAGLTIVLIEHDVGFIRQTCDEVVVLDFGQVIAAGTPDEVVRHEAVQRAYLGTASSLPEVTTPPAGP